MKQFESVGEILKALRLSFQQTLKDSSRSTGLSVSYISDIERGRTSPSLKTLVKLCKHYRVNVSDLLKGIL